MIKLNRLSKVKPASKQEMDSVARAQSQGDSMRRASEVLLQAQTLCTAFAVSASGTNDITTATNGAT